MPDSDHLKRAFDENKDQMLGKSCTDKFEVFHFALNKNFKTRKQTFPNKLIKQTYQDLNF